MEMVSADDLAASYKEYGHDRIDVIIGDRDDVAILRIAVRDLLLLCDLLYTV